MEQRKDGRMPDQARPVTIETDFVRTAAGSCLITMGNTKVICTAMVEKTVPGFQRSQGQGWVHAEYAMLPASTRARRKRDGLKKDHRVVEISLLLSRCMRQAVDLTELGDRTIMLDCDVLQADGSTRVAAITGAMVALVCAVARLMDEGKLLRSPIRQQVAAVSVGLLDGKPCLDLSYEEENRAQAMMNIAMNEKGEFVTLNCKGEGHSISQEEMDAMLALGRQGIETLMTAQQEALAEAKRHLVAKPTLVVASTNPHKIRELQHIFGDYYTVVSMVPAGFNAPIEETASTFAGNAAIKAETVCAATGLPTLADDSGLTVEALDGDPGVYSARYAAMAGEGYGDAANNALLLRRMRGKTARACAFECALALKIPGQETRIALGSCPGVLLEKEQGTGGFGYDPLFLYEPLNKTFAEVTEEEKNRISHRAKACEKMLEIMKELHQ